MFFWLTQRRGGAEGNGGGVDGGGEEAGEGFQDLGSEAGGAFGDGDAVGEVTVVWDTKGEGANGGAECAVAIARTEIEAVRGIAGVGGDVAEEV